MRAARAFLPWVFAVTLMFGLLLLALLIPAFSMGFYEKEFDKYHVYETIDVSKSETLTVTRHMLDYLRGKNDDLQVEVAFGWQITPSLSSTRGLFFSERAVDHMVDVKRLVRLAIRVCSVCVIVAGLIAANALMARDGRERWRRMAKATLWASAGIVVAGGLLAAAIAMDFERAFETFHHLFFTNDLWLLSWDDRLLNIVPEGFFMDIAARIGLLALAFYAAANGAALAVLKWTRGV